MLDKPSVNSSELIEMKDTEKYQRQVGSKALVMTSLAEKKNYETAVRLALEEQKKRESVDQRINVMEAQLNNLDAKLDNISNLLSTFLTDKMKDAD